MTILSAPELLVGSTIVGPGAVVMEDGLIREVLDHVPATTSDHVRLTTGLLTAGMVDLQVNGCFGADFADASPDEWISARQRLLRTGITSFLPTLITASIPELTRQLDRVVAAAKGEAPFDAARILGVHLEGPFLSPLRAGAHDPALMTDPTTANLDLLLADGRGAAISVMTLAPERPGMDEAIRRITAAGIVVSVGHTDATAKQVSAAADAGATMVTHLFNAQRALHQREPGVPGAALDDPRYRLGLIADLHHVAGPVVRLAFAAAPERVVLVTDAVTATGMPPGTYTLGGQPAVVASPDEPPRRPDGTLAGSTLTLDRAVRNVVGLGISRPLALRSATAAPADVIGRPDLGRLSAGAVADLVWWDKSLSVRGVWLGGAARTRRSTS